MSKVIHCLSENYLSIFGRTTNSLHGNNTLLYCLSDCCLGVVNVAFLTIIFTANIFCSWGVLGNI